MYDERDGRPAICCTLGFVFCKEASDTSRRGQWAWALLPESCVGVLGGTCALNLLADAGPGI